MIVLIAWLALILGSIGIALWLVRNPGAESIDEPGRGDLPADFDFHVYGRPGKLTPPRHPQRNKVGW